jgi:LysW-gamma-L-lysine carboxypeptidase
MRLNDPLRLLQQMLEIYSPSGKEKKLALFLKDKFLEFGFEHVRIDAVGNVYGEVGSGGPKILLCGHMDTVPVRLPVVLDNEKMFGRGAVDAKAALAAMIVAASRFIGTDKEGSLVVVGVVGEEEKGEGVRELIRNELNVNFAIFGEPSGVKNITRGYRGKVDVEITCETDPGHSSAPQTFNNAIEKIYELWEKVKTGSWKKETIRRSMYYSTTLCITSIRGGGVSGVIPSMCTMDIEVRMPPSTSCQKIIDGLNDDIQLFQLENPEVRIKMMVTDKVEPFIAPRDSPLIHTLTQAIKETVGGPVTLLRKTGTGDMNIFASKTKIPVITYGPGNSHLSHTLHEHVELMEYLDSIEVYYKTIKTLLSQSHGTVFSNP